MKLTFLFLVACCAFVRAANVSAVWANEGGDKVTRDELRASHGTVNLTGTVLNRVWNGTTVTLAGAKNEVLGFNLVLEAATAQASSVTVSFTTLTGPGGATIASTPTTGNGVYNWTQRNIELFYARYVQIKGLSFFGYFKGDERQIPTRFQASSGLWTDRPDHDKFYPDPLVPLELVGNFNIASGQNQSIFVDIYIPGSAPPGTYTGTITVKEGGTTTKTVPVSLTVYGFSLPDMPAAKTFINLDTHDINKRFIAPDGRELTGPEALRAVAITDKYYELFHRHKISLIGDNDCAAADHPCDTSLPRLNGSLFTAANGYNGPGVSKSNDTFSIGTYGTWGAAAFGIPDWRSDQTLFGQHIDAWQSWFNSNLPNVEHFLYLADEPSANPCNGQQFCTDIGMVQNWAHWINTDSGAGHDLLSFSTYPFVWAQTQAPDLDVPAMAGGIGACPRGQATCDNTAVTQAAANYYSSTTGKRLWMYNDGHPGSGTWMTEADGVDTRTIPWAQYKKNVSRWFYWFANVGCCDDYLSNALTWGSYNRTDPNIGLTGDNGTSNGNGLIVYSGTDLANPGDSYGVDGPIASLRMKEYRRGIQDIDYVTLAKQVNATATQAIVNAAMPKALWENPAPGGDVSYFVGPISWSSNPDDWEAKRAQLAAIINGSAPPPAIVIPTPTSPIGQASAAAWPGHVATVSDLLVAADHATTTLSAGMTSGATTMAVTDASLFVVNQAIVINDLAREELKITAKSGNTLTVTRGVAGTTAQAHSANTAVLGEIGAIYPNQMAAELAAFEGDRFGHIGSTTGVTPSLGPGTTSWPYHPVATGDLFAASDFADTKLTAGVDASSLTLTVADGRAFVPYELITVEREQMKTCATGSTSLTICSGSTGGTTNTGSTGGSYAASGPLTISGATGTVVTKKTITNPSGPCLTITNSTSITISDVEIGPCGGNAISISGSNGVNVFDSYIHTNSAGGACCDTRDGIFASGGNTNLLIQGNVIAYNETNIELSNNNSNTTITGNFLLNPLGPNDPRGQNIQVWGNDSAHAPSGIVITNNYVLSRPSGFLFPENQEDSINFGFVQGATVSGNYVSGGHSASGCGIIADDSANNIQIRNNRLLDTGQCGIGIADGTNQVVDGNKVYNRTPVSGGGNTAIFTWKIYTNPCGPLVLSNNIADSDLGGGSHNAYWDGGGCSPALSANTFDAAADTSLNPVSSVFAPPSIPPSPHGCVVHSPYSNNSAMAACAGSAPSAPDHIVIVMEENHGYSQIIGSSAAPYMNSLASQGVLLTNYFAVSHPSEPNYLALYAGSTFGVTDDNNYSFSAATMASELVAAGKTIKGYVESTGQQKHNPWESFPADSAVEANWSTFPSSSNYASLPTVTWVIPNQNDDMHDGTIGQADTWLQSNLDAYAQWAKTHNSLLIVVWDEDDDVGGNNQVPAIIVGANAPAGTTVNTAYNHYSLLRAVEQWTGIGLLGSSSSATAVSWSTAPGGGSAGSVPSGRGAGGTAAVPHAANAPVHARISATQIRRIAGEIAALETDLFTHYGTGGAAVDLAWPNHAATTMELLSACTTTLSAACYNHMANEIMAVEASVLAGPVH